ncbi:membrane protein [Cellvibrio zantedeschiae]|uniref:Membrane protein n=1 Tax=Cellvibrio zantedeschiae TaxID=1237077 RepID=A0ABQ3ASA6_9GAMM|nr:FxsA family protein [Cellvibrio zantedeschiae]GGY63015.1 membrane protein [Cellvibrio zantedeschiae]
MRLGLLWFLVVLFAEIWSIIKMSEHIGGWATFVLLIAGFFFGLQLMRAQGINAMIKANLAAQTAKSPLGPIAEGIVKAFAGVLLIIPGFFSDLIAILILLPFVRKGFARYLAKKGQFQGFANGSFGSGGFGAFGGFGRPSANDDFAGGNVYEHDGSAKVNTASDRTLKDKLSGEDAIEGEVIELKTGKKPKDPT